jgi:hypothetical protein
LPCADRDFLLWKSELTSVKPYMRISAFALFVLLLWGCSPRILNGSYTTGVDLVSTQYFFRSDSTFSSSGWTSLGSDTGTGRYRLTRDSLFLYFDTVRTKAPVFTADSLPAHGDSCVFTVQCLSDSEQVPFALVTARARGVNSAAAVADLNGMAVLKVPRSAFPVDIECRCAGYIPVRITFRSPADYTVSVSMSSSLQFAMPAGNGRGVRCQAHHEEEDPTPFCVYRCRRKSAEGTTNFTAAC